MKTKSEIEARKLYLYDKREEFKQLADKAKKDNPTNEFYHAALDVAYSSYTAKITEIDWVLNNFSEAKQ